MCLHPKCRGKGLRHYIVTECDEATLKEVRKLLDEHKKINNVEGKYRKEEAKKLKFDDEEKFRQFLRNAKKDGCAQIQDPM